MTPLEISLHRLFYRKWNKKEHYGNCGQSCPCCRANLKEEIGSCKICLNALKIIK